MRIFRIAFVTLVACVLGQLCSAQGIISTVAGNGSLGDSGDGGPATSASLGNPTGVVVEKAGNIYIADSIFNVIRKVNTKGIISTFAGGIAASLGDGGPATSARLALAAPHIGLAVDSSGNVYITDPGDMRVRKVDTSGKITTVAGNSTTIGLGSFSGDGGAATSAGLNSPYGVALDSKGNLYIADYGNQRIRKVDTSGKISTIAGVGFVTGSDTGDGGPATKAELHGPTDVAVDSAGNVYIADPELRQINTSGIINTVGHGSFGTCNQTPTPASGSDIAANGLAVDSAGNVYIADRTGGCIEELETDGLISSIAGGGGNLNGDGGPATSAALTPSAVALDSSGNLYITSVYDVRKVTESGVQPSQKPIISTTSGVVNGASFTIGIAPNTFVTINGTNFSTVTDTWTVTGGVLPTSLDGVSVSFGGLPGYVNYVSPTQINVLTPANLTGEFTNVIVTNSAGASVPSLVVNSEYMPAFFTWPGNQVVATHSDFTFAVKNGTFPGTTTVPAKPGETIILWGTGFGPTMPATPEGTIVPSNQTYSTTVLPTLQLNLVYATVYGVALAPGFAGLYQLAFQVPSALSDGDYQLFANAGAPEADAPMLTVQQ